MKSSTDKTHYFSAYPLKALNLPEEEYQSELSLRNIVTVPSASRIRVLPMVNPYKESDFLIEVENDLNLSA